MLGIQRVKEIFIFLFICIHFHLFQDAYICGQYLFLMIKLDQSNKYLLFSMSVKSMRSSRPVRVSIIKLELCKPGNLRF